MSSGPLDVPPERGGPPPELRQQIIERGSAALEGLVDPERRSEAVTAVLSAVQAQVVAPMPQMQVTATQHVGPVPAPETMEHYEQILSGSADRMFRMAERDQEAMIASNRREQMFDIAFRSLSLLSGVVGLGAILSVIVHLAERGHENVAMSVTALGVGGVIGALVNARMNKGN